MKSAFIHRYYCIIVLGIMLAGCRSSVAPSSSSDIAYEITGRDDNNHGIIHIISEDETQVEWDAWLDWHDGGRSARCVFHATLKLGKSGVITQATITRHPDETLHISVLADHLHCELNAGKEPSRTFNIATNGAALFIPPLPFPINSTSVLCFDPFSWDYVVAQTKVDGLESIGLYVGGRKTGEIKTNTDGIERWELPLTALAKGANVVFNVEAVPAAAVAPPTLTAQDLARISILTTAFDVAIPSGSVFDWSAGADYSCSGNNCIGEWAFSNKGVATKAATKNRASEEAGWGVNPALLAAVAGVQTSPQPAAIPSSPLSALVRGKGDDSSRAWLAATMAQEQGWQARISGGIVLRPGRDYTPVITQWAEVLRDGTVEIADADVAAGYHLRLWTAPQPLYGISGKVAVKAVQVVSPAPWRISPPATDNRAWQWELNRDGAILGRMTTDWQVNLLSSRPTIALSYQGDSMNLPLSGNITVEVDGGGHVWGYLSPELAKSPWMLLALGKGWLLCPVGDGTVAGLALYFVCCDENGWLPPMLWGDGQPAEVREAGEGTYSDGRELRRVHRYRVDPPGLLVSVADGGELMEVRGDTDTWRRVHLIPQRLSTQY